MITQQGDFRFYRNNAIEESAVENTFNYIFHKFKKGIFVQSLNGELKFISMSKRYYRNEWGNMLEYDDNVFQKATEQCGRRWHPHGVLQDSTMWYANNGIFRYENPIQEKETNVDVLKDMFEALGPLPNAEFFVNRRDSPLLTNDRTEPYDCIYGKGVSLVSHNYEKMAPILSMCGRKGYADIPIPTYADWKRANDFPEYTTSWSEKVKKAVFRGKSTGMSVSNNMRVKLAKMKSELLDVGIVAWQTRPRIENGVICTFDDEVLSIPLVNYLTYEEQSKYKYVIHVEGHTFAFRLGDELLMGSVVLLQESEYTLWFTDGLKPYVHYVPIAKDLSDLHEKLDWCTTHDAECEQIANNAKAFARENLTRDKILEYLRNVIASISPQFEYVHPYQDEYQLRMLYSATNIPPRHLTIPSINSKHECFVGLCLNEYPYFVRTYGYSKDAVFVQSYREETLTMCIQEKRYARAFEALKQVLHYMTFVGHFFYHGNLTCDNVIVFGRHVLIRDFSKSSIIHNNRWYGPSTPESDAWNFIQSFCTIILAQPIDRSYISYLLELLEQVMRCNIGSVKQLKDILQRDNRDLRCKTVSNCIKKIEI